MQKCTSLLPYCSKFTVLQLLPDDTIKFYRNLLAVREQEASYDSLDFMSCSC